MAEVKPDPVVTPPTLQTKWGRAWATDLVAYAAKRNLAPESHGSLSSWVLECPWAHPIWHSYVINLMHLRPLVPPLNTIFHLPGATHEIWLQALNPDKPRQPGIDGSGDLHPLRPSNFAAQFISTDTEAIALVENAVRMCLDGKLSPDEDWMFAWANIFGDNMIKKNPKPAITISEGSHRYPKSH